MFIMCLQQNCFLDYIILLTRVLRILFHSVKDKLSTQFSFILFIFKNFFYDFLNKRAFFSTLFYLHRVSKMFFSLVKALER